MNELSLKRLFWLQVFQLLGIIAIIVGVYIIITAVKVMTVGKAEVTKSEAQQMLREAQQYRKDVLQSKMQIESFNEQARRVKDSVDFSVSESKRILEQQKIENEKVFTESRRTFNLRANELRSAFANLPRVAELEN